MIDAQGLLIVLSLTFGGIIALKIWHSQRGQNAGRPSYPSSDLEIKENYRHFKDVDMEHFPLNRYKASELLKQWKEAQSREIHNSSPIELIPEGADAPLFLWVHDHPFNAKILALTRSVLNQIGEIDNTFQKEHKERSSPGYRASWHFYLAYIDITEDEVTLGYNATYVNNEYEVLCRPTTSGHLRILNL